MATIRLSLGITLTGLTISLVLCPLVPKAFVQGSAQLSEQSGAATTLIVTVTDKKDAPVNALPATSFSIPNKNVIQEIVDLKQPDTPTSIAIVFDLSGSMGNGRDGKASKRSQSALAGLARFVQDSHPSNEYFLIGFNDKARSLRERFQDANATIADINTIATLTFRNGAALYDALQLAVNKVSQSAHSKQAIILLTDSNDNSSQTTFKQTVRLLEQATALVYSIVLLPDDYSDMSGGSSLDAEMHSILKEFASLSGGKYIQTKGNQELNVLMERLAIELRSQYLVSVRLASNLEKKCHEFKLKLTANNSPELKSSSTRTRKVICVK